MARKGNSFLLPALQGTYYVLTGLWPMVHLPSFLAVTGPKDDLWLVKMVGLLAASIGLSLLAPLYRRKNVEPAEGSLLGIASALSFLAIDVYYVAVRVIPPVYLLDAVLELIIIVWWLLRLGKASRTT